MVISFLVEIKISWEFNVTLVYPCSIHFHIKPLKIIYLQAIGISTLVALYFIVRTLKTRGRRKAKK